MEERLIIAIASGLAFIIVALTPVVPISLYYYDINNIYITKAMVGLLTLFFGYGVIWALRGKKENTKIKDKDGKMHLRLPLLAIGLVAIGIAWFTTVPDIMASSAGLSNVFTYKGDELTGGIGVRIFTSMLTGIGILCIRFSTFRDKSDYQRPVVDEATYQKLLDKEEGGGGIKW